MADSSLIIKESDLRELLGVSRAAMFVWRRRGLPVVMDGGPGRAPLYNMNEVDGWLRRTGLGIRCANGASVNVRALRAEIDRRAPAGFVQTYAPPPQARSAAPAAALLPDRQVVGAFIGEVFQRGVPGWCAFVTARYNLDADVVLEIVQDMVLFLVAEAAEILRIEEPDDFEFIEPDWIDRLRDPAKRVEILTRVNALADDIRREIKADAAGGEASADG